VLSVIEVDIFCKKEREKRKVTGFLHNYNHSSAVDNSVSFCESCPSCGSSEMLRALLGADSTSVFLLAKVQLF
jgi:hypothetical protein